LSQFPGTSGRTQFDGLKKISPGATDVSGIGDAAFANMLGTSAKVTVLKGEMVIAVTSVDSASATKLAKAVLGRT
jgi:acetaldehyde dehydrogenase (acetylating)